MDMIDGIIVGAAAAAIGSIIAYHFINRQPIGGMQPMQPAAGSTSQFGRTAPVYVIDLPPGPNNMAPVVWAASPNPEAAFNVQPTGFEQAFGPDVNQPAQVVVLPA